MLNNFNRYNTDIPEMRQALEAVNQRLSNFLDNANSSASYEQIMKRFRNPDGFTQ
jgi:hypothetical protein